ncbi:MAG TPA: OmpA family protein [Terriglobales bacterium]|nr:OmpA family protein [Terriglobales bacterium]
MPNLNCPTPNTSQTLMMGALAAALLVAGGCTTKNYVRQQTTPLIDHVNQLNVETAKNTNDIKAVDQRTQQGLQQVNASSQQALQKAQQVQAQAQQVGQQLQQTSGQISALDATMANLDDYKQTSQATVNFAFDKAVLTPEAQQTLDGVAAQLQQNAHGILEVQGYTDSTGPRAYNDKLSQRRADSVVRYLEAKNIAPHRIFLIGLGENQAVAPNTTLAGRKANRRVDLKVLSNNLGSSSQQ